MRIPIRLFATLGVLGLVVPGARAATLDAAPLVIGVGEIASVEIVLALEASELASSFQAELAIDGRDLVAELLPSFGGPSWSSAEGNDLGSSLGIAMLSDNAGGERVVATLEATGLAPGVVEISLVSAIAAFDLATPPYFAALAVGTAMPDDLVALITVMPEPGGMALVGLLGIALLGARRLSPRFGRAR